MTIERLLQQVEKPSRYIGGEVNSCVKPFDAHTIRCAFSFPDVYEVGMSHLGLHILYAVLNGLTNVFCERVFAPWPDMEGAMRAADVDLFTLETKTPVRRMDILGFTLQYELSYTNILNMLSLSNIPFRRVDRDASMPLVIAGGPCAFNPEPIADFIDIFFVGESEASLPEFIELYRGYKAGTLTKRALLKAAAGIEGLYVPEWYTPIYAADGILLRMEAEPGVPERVKKRIVKHLDAGFQLEKMIIPFADAVHDRAMVELFRGCTKGCRFCQAGMIYRPVRERSLETIRRNVENLLNTSGYEEVSLTSLSTLDYTGIQGLIADLVAEYAERHVGISLPSLRLDSFSVDAVSEIQKIRKTGLTFAPEAGTQRLRDVINKGVCESDILRTFEAIFALGWYRVKLYFMIGLPTETEADLKGIAEIGNLATYTFKRVKPEDMQKGVQVTLSTSCFVPKPFTPFQWMAQSTREEFYEKIHFLKSEMTNRKVKYNYHDPETSVLEGVFARGDRRLGAVIERAHALGCAFDGWAEHFKPNLWAQAFEDVGINPDFYTVRLRDEREFFPWDVIDAGVDKQYLWNEYQCALRAEVTPDCRQGCTGCGVNVSIVKGDCLCL